MKRAKELLNLNKSSKKKNVGYYAKAKLWAEDYYDSLLQSKRRYQWAFFGVLFLAFMLVIAIVVMMPLVRLETIVVHHGQDGMVWLSKIEGAVPNINVSQIKSDAIRYVRARESYVPNFFPYQYRLVNLMSSQAVAIAYRKGQSALQHQGFVYTLGTGGTRQIKINSVVILQQHDVANSGSSLSKKNLLQIDFTVSEKSTLQRLSPHRHYVAYVSWLYRGLPKSPRARWDNWDGFEVASYRVVQKFIG